MLIIYLSIAYELDFWFCFFKTVNKTILYFMLIIYRDIDVIESTHDVSLSAFTTFCMTHHIKLITS